MENLILNKVKQWFIDRDLENGGRLDKQSLKLSEEFGELCAGFLKKNEALTKDSIGDCAVVVVGLALLIKEDVQSIFEESNNIRRKEAMDCFKLLNANISEFQLSQDLASKKMCRHNLVRIVAYLKSISNILGYEFLECFTLSFLNVKPATYAPFDNYYWDNCEVIGNIYENELDLIVYEAYKYNKETSEEVE